MRTKRIGRTVYLIIFTVLILGPTSCQFGDEDALDSFNGSGDSLFVAVAEDPFICTSYISNDGKIWFRGTEIVQWANSIAYGQGKFIVAGYYNDGSTIISSIFISYDGINWSEYRSNELGITLDVGEFFNTIAFGNNIFVMGTDEGKFFYSLNGIQWHRGVVDQTLLNNGVDTICFGNGRFFATMAAAETGPLAVSLDAIHWYNTHSEEDSYQDIAYGNTIFALVGNRTLRISQNGLNWSANVIPSLVDNNEDLYCIVHGNKRFVAAGRYVNYDTKENGNIIYTSQNGFIWNGPIAMPHQIDALTYCNGIFIAVGSASEVTYAGYIAYSEDGYTWSGNIAPSDSVSFNMIAVRP